MRNSSRRPLYADRPQRWVVSERCFKLSIPTSPDLAFCTPVVISDSPDAGIVWHLASIELVILWLPCFLATPENGNVRYECHDWRVAHASWVDLVAFLSRLHRRIDHLGLALCVTGVRQAQRLLTLPTNPRRKSIGLF